MLRKIKMNGFCDTFNVKSNDIMSLEGIGNYGKFTRTEKGIITINSLTINVKRL